MRSPAPFSGVVHPGSARFITPARRWLPPDLRSADFQRRSRSRLCGPELDFDGLPWARTMALLMRPPSNIPPDAGRTDLLSGDLLRRFRAGSQVAGGKSDRESNGFSYARRALLLRAAWRSSRSDRLAALVGLSPCGGKRLAIRRTSAAQQADKHATCDPPLFSGAAGRLTNKLRASGSPPLIPKHGPACERTCTKFLSCAPG